MSRRATWLAVLLASTFGCSSEDLTQLMVSVDTDFDVPEALDEITIEVIAPDGLTTNSSAALDEADLPMRLAVVHRSGPLGPVRIKVEGLLRGETQIQRRAEVYFVEGEVRELRMDLLRSCKGVSCAVDETCGADGCRARRITEEELGPWEGPMRLDFGPPDMGPMDMTTDGCVPTEEVCNDADDDCDGEVDETFDFDTDMRHCGGCDRPCEPDPVRGSEACVMGTCILSCDPGFGDCDAEAPGCESSLSSAATCGDCDQTCAGGTPICDLDTCVTDCPDGTTLCTDSCVDLDSSVRNCGTCGNECADAENASPLCAEGSCGLRCDTGFFNCDMDGSDGCESRLRELTNCGACGAICEADAATTSCATGDCELVGCDMGYGDCDGDPMNGCEADLAGSPTTCGTCDTTCPTDPANAASICEMGSCGLACDPGYGDCDSNPANGCETFLGETTSCGGCGILCDGATPVCSGSSATGFACAPGCADDEVVCGESCVDISSDARNCDGCGNICPDPTRASPTCTDGTCGFTCDAGFANCNGDDSDGCEADLASTEDCGSCDNVCDPVTNGTVACETDGCAIASCAGTNRDCDGTYANGCEADIETDPAHCGGCGVVCTPGPRVSTVGCDGGACVIESCETGYADCDGDFATGCETRLGTKFHCGSCGDRCRGGGTNMCCDGVCGSC
jgi:hypothetical protein